MSIFTVVQYAGGDISPWSGTYASLSEVEASIREDMAPLLAEDGFQLTEISEDGENQHYCAVEYAIADDETAEEISFYITEHK